MSFAPPYPNWCWQPSQIGISDKVRLDEAQFGDGYRQRMLDGINYMDIEWDLGWEMVDAANLKSMSAYLVARRGQAFNFYDPTTNETHSVFCDEWSIRWDYKTYKNGVREDRGTLSATFVKAYGVTVAA